ncbi:hypothetical protein CEXT_50311 [Caerostris extrusa]|uniref:Uncharacterized protein n=1 Tax=Caerostris extrusa TaxID=172846 RepID=A0AAV4X4A2_CAEEX|nr:hypothetical protein CEXT_50311 [Caerostris extrusa]
MLQKSKSELSQAHSTFHSIITALIAHIATLCRMTYVIDFFSDAFTIRVQVICRAGFCRCRVIHRLWRGFNKRPCCTKIKRAKIKKSQEMHIKICAGYAFKDPVQVC